MTATLTDEYLRVSIALASPGRVLCVCEQCGKQFTRWRSEANNGRNKTCSSACQRDRARSPRVQCPLCGDRFARIEQRRCAKPACRFWTKVNKNGPTLQPALGPCWLWTAGTTKAGYGQAASAGLNRYAHRVSWRLTHGPVPDGLWVLHKCDNPPCLNPAHLFLGTAKDNAMDREAKGRHPLHRNRVIDYLEARH